MSRFPQGLPISLLAPLVLPLLLLVLFAFKALLLGKESGKVCSSSRDSGADCSDWAVQDLRSLIVREVEDLGQGEGISSLWAQSVEQLVSEFRSWTGRRHSAQSNPINQVAVAHPSTHMICAYIPCNGIQPGAHSGVTAK